MGLISPRHISSTLDAALSTGASFAEIFVENSHHHSWELTDSQPRSASLHELYGAGIRVHFGLEEFYVTTNNLSEDGLIAAAKKAAACKSGSETKKSQTFHMQTQPLSTKKITSSQNTNEIFSFLSGLDKKVRAQSSLVTQVVPTLNSKVQNVLIANSEGVWVENTRRNDRVICEVFVENLGRRESFRKNFWSTKNSSFYEEQDTDFFSRELVSKANNLLKANYAPAGEMPVVIDNGFGGVIFHEACAHGLETTAIAQNSSVFCGRLGEKIAPEFVTAVDDGTIEDGWGSLDYDDEGMKSQRTVLIEKGILKSYMVDRLGAMKTGYKRTGSGRRQSYQYAPTSRMRNTFLEN